MGSTHICKLSFGFPPIIIRGTSYDRYAGYLIYREHADACTLSNDFVKVMKMSDGET